MAGAGTAGVGEDVSGESNATASPAGRTPMLTASLPAKGTKVIDYKGRTGVVELHDMYSDWDRMPRSVYVRWLKKDGTPGKRCNWLAAESVKAV